MELKKENEVSPRYPYAVFRNSALYNSIGVMILAPIAVLVIIFFLKGKMPLSGFIVAEIALSIFMLIFSVPLVKSFSSHNWLMKADADKLYIKIRSYLNAHLSADSSYVIALEYDEIKWVRQTRIKETTEKMKGTETSYVKYLDVCMNSPASDEAAKAIENETQFKTEKYHYYDCPVCVKEGNILRIRFGGVTPRAANAVKYFANKNISVQSKNYETSGTTSRVMQKYMEYKNKKRKK